jgi:hydroxyacylglutathione hydrolase
MTIVTIPCLEDNYAFLLHDTQTGDTAVIDVPDAAPIKQALADHGWTLTHVLLTHHHWDHVDGLPDLLSTHPAKVIGATADAHRLPPLDLAVAEGDTFSIGTNPVHVFDVSGHTLNHIAFHFPGSAALATADSLMALGCGRLFEGTPAQMHDSLNKLAALPPETTVLSGHEYTESNARFACSVDPHNPDLLMRVEAIRVARAKGKPTVPSSLAEELATNPFLRCHTHGIQKTVGMIGAPTVEVFTEVRKRKDKY